VNFYTLIGNFAVWAVPIAPASFFAITIYDALVPRLGVWLALFVAIVGAAGFETVGILNGHAMVQFWNQKKYSFAIAATILLISYVAIGLYELGATIGGVMIVIGFIVYLTQGLLTEHRHGRAEKQAADEQRRQAQLAAQRAQLERERLAAENEQALKLARLAAQKEIKLLETSQNVRETFPPTRETFPKLSETFPRDWRKLSPEQRDQIATMNEADIVLMAGVDVKTARAWLKKLQENGNEH
jgi:type II secretory pathway pseudopilin PulG